MAAAAPVALAMAAAGQLLGGIEANRAGKVGAAVDTENARRSILQGEQESMQTRRDERAQSGEMIAAMGGSGIELGSGSSADLLAQSAYQRELEVLNIRTRRSSEANNLLQSAADRKAAGRAALVQGVFGAASTALKGVSDMRAKRTAADQASKERAVILGGGTVPRMSVSGGGW